MSNIGAILIISSSSPLFGCRDLILLSVIASGDTFRKTDFYLIMKFNKYKKHHLLFVFPYTKTK